MRRALAAGLAAALLAIAGGCDKLPGGAKASFNGIDVTGGDMGGPLRLEDPDGRPRSLADFHGKAVVVFFGYTHCPDVCPTTLSDLAKAMREMGEAASQVQVLFVTLDPKRDTAEVMRQYAPAFHPSFLGLRGDEAATAKAAKEFHVYGNIREGKGGEYTVDHSAQVFVFDREGRVRLIFPPGLAPPLIAADLKALLAK